jgi:nicotinamidase-related amidase
MLTIRRAQVRETLDELVEPRSTALVVIDMQNDLCHADGAFAAAGADISAYPPIVPTIASLVGAARAASVLIIWVRVTSSQTELFQSPAQLRFELRMKNTYGRSEQSEFDFATPGTWGHEFLEGLGYRAGDAVVDKRRSSGFAGTDLDMLLREAAMHVLTAYRCDHATAAEIGDAWAQAGASQ